MAEAPDPPSPPDGSPFAGTPPEALASSLRVSPPVENLVLAQGSDYAQGDFFNRTRLYIKQGSIHPANQSPSIASPSPHESALPPSGTFPITPLIPQLSKTKSIPASGDADRPSRRPAAVSVENYLESLLPTSGFNGNASASISLPALGGFGAAPPTPQLTAHTPLTPQFPLAKESGPAAGPSGGRSDESVNTSMDDDASVRSPGEYAAGLMATYQFQQVTADGGVALAFDNLEGSVDTECLERLHNAIDTLMSEQNHTSPTQLEQVVAREVKALTCLNNSLRASKKQIVINQQGDADGSADGGAAGSGAGEPKEADASPGKTSESGTEEGKSSTSRGTPANSGGSNGSQPKVALETVEEAEERQFSSGAPAASRPTSATKLVPLPPLVKKPAGKPPGKPPVDPVTAAAVAKEPVKANGKEKSPAGSSASDAPAPAQPGGEKTADEKQDEKLASLRLLQKLQSVKDQLTATIQLGFQQGRFKSLNIAILVVGTRGDVQPFVGIGLKLQSFGHRVRIASHKVYREFVTGFGLEFYPLGGDPKVLSEFVVKHRGIMPGWNIADALQQREQVREILYSTWGACTAPDPMRPDKVFRADAIIANPPSYGHSHCAEALNVPLHVVFTMPWTPTKAFPQPFARIRTNMGQGQNSKAREVMNWMSYFAMEDLAWLGMAGMQKDFRQRVLKLATWNKYTTSHAIYYSQVPITYIWSPSLVPRPADWPMHCEVVGFCSVELRKLTSYDPPAELKAFLDDGPAPVYIGFGSLVVDQPAVLTQHFLAAIHRTGLRAIIQRGWGGLGAEYGTQPDGKPGKKAPANVLFIDSAPHDWLFQCVSAVVHHGGAGTTAAGLLAGKPTFIVPFFGDQPFWGAACEQAGVGPEPVPIDDLTTEKIVDALKELILPTRQKAAKALSETMLQEDGIAAAVDHIHRTIYTTLLGRNTPIWMQNAKPPGQATTSIQELEDEEGAGLLRGMLQLPTRIFRGLKGPGRGSQASMAGAASAGSRAVSGLPNGVSAGGHSSSSMAGALTPRPVESVGGEVRRKGGFLSFLGC